MNILNKLLVTLVAFWTQYSLAAESVIFSSRTEILSRGYTKVPPTVLAYVLSSISYEDKTVKDLLGSCLVTDQLPAGDYSTYLKSRLVNLTSGGTKTYFVRGALSPYCYEIYGAHSFYYWFVSESPEPSYLAEETSKAQWTLFSGVSDEVEVLGSHTNRFRDIRTRYFRGARSDVVVYKFDGNEYNASECFFEDLEIGQTYRTPCGK